MIKAIVVDDEQHCIDRIAHLLSHYKETVELAAVCGSNKQAMARIKQIKPDVVFLDVQLQGETGFDLLNKLKTVDFEIIFTTAYENHAIKAFRFSALDFLLKPIDEDEFREALYRLKEKNKKKDGEKRLEVLFHNFENRQEGMKKIAIPTLKDFTFLNIPDIIRCESDGNYTQIFSLGNKRLTSTKTLKYFEDFLGDTKFFRIHKSHYINLSHVDKYIKGKGGHVVMSDGTKLEVAIRRKEEFIRRFRV